MFYGTATRKENMKENELDEIDDSIARLFKRRMELVGAAANPARDRAALARAADIVGAGNERAATMLFTTLFGIADARRRTAVCGESPVAKAVRDAAQQLHHETHPSDQRERSVN